MQNKEERKLLITEEDQEKMLAEFVDKCESEGLTEDDYKIVYNHLKEMADHVRNKNG